MERTIACFHSTATASALPKIDGIYRAALDRGWNVRRFDIRSAAQIAETLGYWRPDGCIVDAAADNVVLPRKVFGSTPVVYLDCAPRFSADGRSSCVIQNAEAIARAAAEELLKNDPKSLVYAAWPERQFWSEMRGEAFRRILKRSNRQVIAFRSERIEDHRSVLDNLIIRLRDLPRPIGVFAATDTMSEQVLLAARQIGLSVPDDLLIIGVDNEEFVCENARPTLSSVSPGFERAGRQAVAILARLLLKPNRPPIVEKFKGAKAIIRSSTRLSERQDQTVIRALDHIRKHATEGLAAAQVLALFDCSRCLAERRFRTVTGHSILDEIHAVQIEAAKKLIVKPFQKLDSIPQFCGHTSVAFFQRLFKRETGLTMSEWRERS